MQIAILGAGMIGRTMALDLAKKYSVTSFDISGHSLETLAHKDPTIKTIRADLGDFDQYPALLSHFDFVICAVPGFMGYRALESVIKAGKPVVDLSFFPENALGLE